MNESERNFLLAELADKTRMLIQMKIDRRAGKYVSHALMSCVAARIRDLQNILYPPSVLPAITHAKEVTA